MSVKKTRSGKWEARYRDATGSERSKTFTLKADAQRHARDQLAARDRGDWVDPAAGRVTFKSYAEVWRKQQHHRERSASKIEGQLTKHVYPTFGDRRLSSIRPSEIKAWYAGLGLALNTRKSIYGWVAAIFRSAVDDRIIGHSPCTLRLPSKDKDAAPIEALTVAQVHAVCANMPDRLQAAVILAAGSGLRPGEWEGLTVDRIDFLRREIKIDRQLVGSDNGKPVFGPPKSAAGFRTVPVAQAVIDALAVHLTVFEPSSEGLLFTTVRGNPVGGKALYTQWRKACVDAEAPEWATPHDLRHFYASCLIASGCNVKQVQRVLGHESAVVTLDTYAHWWPDSDEAVRDAVVATLFAPAEAAAK